MSIWLALMLFLGGIVCVVFGGDWFVCSSSAIAKKMRIPDVIIGATLVSIATTLPEFIVSTLSASQGAYGLAVGNAVGTVICNTALVCGVCLTLTKERFTQKGSIVKYLILILVSILLLIFSLDMVVSFYESLSLVILVLIYLLINVIDALQVRKEKSFSCIGDTSLNKEIEMPVWKILILFVLGALGIGGGAYSLVEGATTLAQTIGISDEVIGLTVVGLGTSLPELITAVNAIKRKRPGLSVGNVVGSNILNCTLIMGTCGLISSQNGLWLSKQNLYISIPLCIITSLILTLPIILKKKTFKWQGILLLSMYFCYFIFLITNAIFGYFA